VLRALPWILIALAWAVCGSGIIWWEVTVQPRLDGFEGVGAPALAGLILLTRWTYLRRRPLVPYC